MPVPADLTSKNIPSDTAKDASTARLGIDGAVNGVGKLVNWSSGKVRLVQSGQVGFYIFAMVLGITVLFAISFFWIQ